MITTDSVNGVVRRGRLGRTARFAARWRGRRDGARGVPRVPLPAPPEEERGKTPPPPIEPPAPELLITPYVMEVRTGVRRATEQMRAALIGREHALLSRLRAESVRVVTQYDVREDPRPAALARYGHWMGQWRTSVDRCRSHAQAVVDQANQRLACYWDAVRETHHQLSRLPRRPPGDWLPGRVELDGSWYQPDVWLLDDDDSAGTATSRALHILERQNTDRVDGRTAR
ncbi:MULTISPECIES: hypothetical protein [Streptomyces]|uniref:hypothetical protein n=1 Tax=Streptomyces lycopersici TaxID=2974589 RepID=UPI0021D054C7|nr:hypothetical protein [Streptomyces sp. NEAU-383]